MSVYPFFQRHPFSNWWMSSFTVDGCSYSCGEQWMMVQKALLFKDKDSGNKIMRATHPAEMKRLGKKVKNFDGQKWDDVKCRLVKVGIRAKFEQDESLRSKLLQTGDQIICEASPYDKIWGIGISADHRDINNPEKWKGQNLLGKVLMEIRTELR